MKLLDLAEERLLGVAMVVGQLIYRGIIDAENLPEPAIDMIRESLALVKEARKSEGTTGEKIRIMGDPMNEEEPAHGGEL